MRSMWLPAVFGVMFSIRATCRVVPPRATRTRTSTSRGVRPAGAAGEPELRWPETPRTASTAAGLGPEGVRDARPPGVVDGSGAPYGDGVPIRQARGPHGAGGEVGDAPGVPGEPRRLEIGDVGHDLQDGVELRLAEGRAGKG